MGRWDAANATKHVGADVILFVFPFHIFLNGTSGRRGKTVGVSKKRG